MEVYVMSTKTKKSKGKRERREKARPEANIYQRNKHKAL